MTKGGKDVDESLTLPKSKWQVICERIKRKVLEIWNNKAHLFWYILFLYFVAIAFYFIVLIDNSLTIPISGDYCLQQIPFYTNGYDDWWHFLKTGEFVLWDHNTFLGVNNIGTNTFYYLLNPFFLPILLWPREYIAQGLAFLMINKMVFAAITFRIFLKYIGIKENTSRLFALAYAFCGWNVYYLWFNHFMEVAVVFPLVLLGIEKVVRDKRPWVLMASLGLMGLCNYFFLVSSCICGVIYAGYRYFSLWKDKSKNDRFQILIIGFCGFLVGVMIGALTLYTAFPIIMDTPRVNNSNYLKNLMEAWNKHEYTNFFNLITKFEKEKQTYYPLATFLFPTISNFNTVVFNNRTYDNTIGSLFIYTPLMMFFIPSLLQSIRKKRWSNLVATAFFLLTLFTPFFYYLCYGFTVTYGRWQIFAVASLLMFIARNYEEREEMPRWFFDISIGVLLIGVIILLSYALSYQSNSDVYNLGDRSYVVIAEVIYMLVCYFYLRFRHHEKELTKFLTNAVAIEAIVMGVMLFNYQSPRDYSTLYGGLANVMEEEDIINRIKEQDDGFYRISNTNADRNNNNLSMREGYNGVASFHSMYNFELNDFLNWSRIMYSSTWSGGAHEKRYNLDEFLNVKYYIQKNLEQNNSISNNIPFGFVEMPEYATTYNANKRYFHKVYYNTNFIELGFAYDSMMYAEHLSDSQSKINNNEIAYLTSAIVYKDDVEEIKSLLDNDIEIVKYSSIKDLTTITTDYTVSYEDQFNRYKEQYKASHPGTNIDLLSLSDQISLIKEWNGFDYAGALSRVENKSLEMLYGGVIELTPTNGKTVCSNAEDDPCYVDLKLRMGENATVQMFNEVSEVDENGETVTQEKLVVWDNHMWHNYSTSGDWKYDRGFYINEDITKIKITIWANATIARPTITVERYSEFQKRIAKLKGENDENLFENIKVTTNNIDFDTTYDQDKIVVLSIPYDNGWSGNYVYENGEMEPIKIFKMQGGFLGFVAKKGNVHYALEYFTPNLKESLVLFTSGIAIMTLSWGAVYVYEHKKKRTPEIVIEDIKE